MINLIRKNLKGLDDLKHDLTLFNLENIEGALNNFKRMHIFDFKMEEFEQEIIIDNLTEFKQKS
jgi:hypothetical protein